MPRSDANAIALRAVRALLGAAHDLTFTLADGREVDVSASVLPKPPWPPGGLEGLDPDRDGDLPPGVRLQARWPGGELRLEALCQWWKTTDSYRHLLGISVRLEGRAAEVAWITFGMPLRSAVEGQSVRIFATLGFNRHKPDESVEAWDAWRRAIRQQSDAAGLPRPKTASVTLCDVAVPTGELIPSAAEAFSRLARVSLLKATVLCRAQPDVFVGDPPFGPLPLDAASPKLAPSAAAASTDAGALRMGLWPLPGGVREYANTAEAMLNAVQEQPGPREALYGFLADRYGVTGPTARKTYVDLLLNLGLLAEDDDGLSLTDAGESWLSDPDRLRLFDHLTASYGGLVELLWLIAAQGPLNSKGAGALRDLLGTTWKSDNQVSFRRNWLLSLGLTEREGGRDRVTESGRVALAGRADQVAGLEERYGEAGGAVGGPSGEGGGEGGTAAEPEPSIGDDLLVLRPEHVRPHLGRYQPPARVVAQCCAALSAGRHLLLVGPPGTGKTELATLLAAAAESEGYCLGLRTATASADWTTFDTIGGYALNRAGELAFRPGLFPRALDDNHWLLVDELNRADVDKAFGELMTVLSGKGTTTPYEDADGRPIHIGPEGWASYRVRPAFRVIATMNTWDKTTLFRLSAALQRRFATVHVGLPEPETYAELLRGEAARSPALSDDLVEPLLRLFSPDGLLRHRAVGPAVPLDMLRYLRHGAEAERLSHGLTEATALSLLSQLEGLPLESEQAVFAELRGALASVSAPAAWGALEARLRELFTTLPEG